ncbi:MAG: PhzF family phenazine biosynthesis protein [Solirubrobacterales bacterium]
MTAREHPGLQVVRVFCDAAGRNGNPLGVFLDGGTVGEAERQPIAHELGFSETVFVDDRERGEMRIFTPMSELAFVGHPVVGTAWLLREQGIEVSALRPPAGEVGVRFDGGLPYAAARPEWGPAWRYERLGSSAEIDALTPPEHGEEVRWAWIDEAAGLVRMRVFAPDDGIEEDEATGSAALQLTAELGRPIEILQGEGSVLYARPLEDGRAEVGGRVVAA